jgi:hypothetical protein
MAFLLASQGLPFATFASLRLSENRRLNEEAHFSPRRQGAKRRHLFLKDHKPPQKFAVKTKMKASTRLESQSIDAQSKKKLEPRPVKV